MRGRRSCGQRHEARNRPRTCCYRAGARDISAAWQQWNTRRHCARIDRRKCRQADDRIRRDYSEFTGRRSAE
jgi:hypothetical protein